MDWPTPLTSTGQSFDPSHARTSLLKAQVKRCLPKHARDLDVLFSRARRQARGGRVVLLGSGGGHEAGFWLPYKPRDIIGVDLDPGSGVAADAEMLPFASGSVDVVGSVNAFEHFRDVNRVVEEVSRVLRLNGALVASFGPLYHTIGGDHLSRLRGGLEHGFNHLLLAPNDYLGFVTAMTLIDDPFADFVARNLFSRISADEYLDILERHLRVRRFTVTTDPEVDDYRKQFPAKWEQLTRTLPERVLRQSAVQVVATRR